MLICYPSVVPHWGLDFQMKYRTLLVAIKFGTTFIALGMVFVPKHGFTGQDSVLENPVRSGLALVWSENINLRTSQYLQIYANMAFMLPILDTANDTAFL